MTYTQKLRDPRWQKKRLEIMQRDDFSCTGCGDNEKMLSVHHRYYLPGKEPWEYGNNCFKTLCEYCHSAEHRFRPQAESNLISALKQMGYDYVDIQLLAQAVCNTGFGNPTIFRLLEKSKLSEDDLLDHTNPIIQPIKGLL